MLHRIDPDGGTQFGFSDTQAKIVSTRRQQFHLTPVAGTPNSTIKKIIRCELPEHRHRQRLCLGGLAIVFGGPRCSTNRSRSAARDFTMRES